MKLHLVIAAVICMRAAMANLTPVVVEHGQHITDAARSGTSIIRNLRSEVATEFAEELKEVFARHAGDLLVYKAKPVDKLETVMKETKKDETFNKLGIDWKDVSLFRNPNFLNWLKLLSAKKFHAHIRVYEKLKEAHGDDIVAMVKTLTVGYMDSRKDVHLWLGRVEHEMLSDWQVNHEWSLKDVFEKLNLNLIKDEKELYGNPAFPFLIDYAVRLHDSLWQENIVKVLAVEEHSKDFRGLAEFAEFEFDPLIKPAMAELSEKFNLIRENRKSWHKLVKTEQR